MKRNRFNSEWVKAEEDAHVIKSELLGMTLVYCLEIQKLDKNRWLEYDLMDFCFQKKTYFHRDSSSGRFYGCEFEWTKY